ncbi:MAG: helix-hairpin-helix domain-containing protein [Cyclobacteriaceae bacterium]|nr:helix-hairpin-helix domain-containing protein [Cyclobacteriaceae bacterium]
MKHWATIIKNLFGISASEYAGFKWLVLTLLLCASGLWFVDKLTYAPYANYKQDKQKLDSLLALMDEPKFANHNKNRPIILSYFDPNTATQEDLQNVGFPNWLAKRVIKYRRAGGKFYVPKDLLKIYDLPDSLYLQIESYVRIKATYKSPYKPNKPNSNQSAKSGDKIKRTPSPKYNLVVLESFDLNKADTSVLQTVKGIGSKLSNRIVNYRTSLGGFINSNQLYHIYKLDSAAIDNLLKVGVIETDFKPQKIHINEASKEHLAAHPYINWNQAKLLIAYRNQHGKYQSLQDLTKVYSIDKDWTKKIASYLTF